MCKHKNKQMSNIQVENTCNYNMEYHGVTNSTTTNKYIYYNMNRHSKLHTFNFVIHNTPCHVILASLTSTLYFQL